MTLTYAGIGARATPQRVLGDMTVIAAWLARRGWRLHTGGAHGADDAFANGAPTDRRTLYLPWPGYNGRQGEDCHPLSSGELDALLPIAAALHPAWNRCSPAVRKLHARNAAILLGPAADRPVHAVVCWTEGGAVSGGTGMAYPHRKRPRHSRPQSRIALPTRGLREARGNPTHRMSGPAPAIEERHHAIRHLQAHRARGVAHLPRR